MHVTLQEEIAVDLVWNWSFRSRSKVVTWSGMTKVVAISPKRGPRPIGIPVGGESLHTQVRSVFKPFVITVQFSHIIQIN